MYAENPLLYFQLLFFSPEEELNFECQFEEKKHSDK